MSRARCLNNLPCCLCEPRHDKTSKMSVRPAKTQISLGIRQVWSDSSLCAQWVDKNPSFLHADSEDSDQIGWMSRLIRVFARRTAILLVLSCRGSCSVGDVFRRRQSIVLYSRQSSAKRLKVVCGDTLAPMSFTYGRNSNEPSKELLSSGQLIKDWCAQSWIMAVRLGTPKV